MTYTFVCDYCGKENSIEWKKGTPKKRFCNRQCWARWRSANGIFDPYQEEKLPGDLPHKDVRVMITQEIPLFPEFRPVVGGEYKAERYEGRAGVKKIGYVIVVNGHRVSIREGECLEVG